MCYLQISPTKMISISVSSDKTGNPMWKLNQQLLRHISSGLMSDSEVYLPDIRLRAALLPAPSPPTQSR